MRQDTPRIPELVPIRYGRMSVSAFTFLRGSAALMARDLATTPSSGIRVQCCGDAHLLNFGAYATPERNLVFDVNDFDETLEAPFEWDVKRLAASVHVAARDKGLSEGIAEGAVLAMARAYRETMSTLTDMTRLEVWYDRVDVDQIHALLPANEQGSMGKAIDKARHKNNVQALRKLGTVTKNGHVRIVDQPPLVYHPPMAVDLATVAGKILQQYRTSLPDDRRRVFDEYTLVDAARKVVGVGSVGLDARIALFLGPAGESDPLFLQMKQARQSVLAPYAGPSPYRHHGRRVVEGQRLMQAASDMFLGWYTGVLGGRINFYVRQLRDMKGSADVAGMTPELFTGYAALCGGTLARAHARSGEPALITGYLGTGDVFDTAIADFAKDYANQTNADYALLQQAITDGRVPCTPGI